MEKLVDFSAQVVQTALDTLLRDRSSGGNIIWATDPPDEIDATDRHEMTRRQLESADYGAVLPRMMKQTTRRQERTRKKGEVFTPAWICCMMNDFIDTQWFGRTKKLFAHVSDNGWTVNPDPIAFPKRLRWQNYVDSRRLEICCGEAPFLASRYDCASGEIIPVGRRIGILDRKLRIVGENTQDESEWFKWALRAYEGTYGYEYQGDNLLIARVNLLLTFAEYCRDRWRHDPCSAWIKQIADVISWNIWQMDGLKSVIPYGKPIAESAQISFDDILGLSTEPESAPCTIRDWRGSRRHVFSEIRKGSHPMKFDFVIGNPPYQKESSDSVSKSNGQKPMTNIFQYFQNAADELTENTSVLVYPGGRWIHQSGKGMQSFGKNQINDKSLSVVEYYPDASELFGDTASLSDGITIVTKNHKKETDGFTYVYSKKGEKFSVHADNPGEDLMPLDPHDLPIEQKINAGMKKHGLCFLHEAILPRSLFPIESDFVEKNPSKVRRYVGSDEGIDFATEIKLFTNDRAGKAGRATWFIANRDVITRNAEYIAQWQVVVSSANAGGQKRDNQLEIIDNHSAFGRSRLALRSFSTYKEAKNFYDYVSSYFVRYTFLLTDEALTSLGKEVPDLQDYTGENPFIDFEKDIDVQLCKLFNINDDEFAYMKNRVTSLRGEA